MQFQSQVFDLKFFSKMYLKTLSKRKNKLGIPILLLIVY